MKEGHASFIQVVLACSFYKESITSRAGSGPGRPAGRAGPGRESEMAGRAENSGPSATSNHEGYPVRIIRMKASQEFIEMIWKTNEMRDNET